MRNSVPRAALVLSISIAIALITGCAAQGGGSAPTGSSPAPSSSPGSADSVGPSDSPRLVDGGTASDNRAYFDRIVTEHIAAGAALDGRSLVDALADAGFDKAAMQVTPDATTLGDQADSVVFSVQIAAECLIGQWDGGAYSSTVAAALGTGGCLPGNTRPIDW